MKLPSGTAGLLGCACVDLPLGIALNCTMLGGGTAWTSPVDWEMTTAPHYLSCARVRVVVQSVRWPEQRVSVGGAGASASCIAAGTCLAADAAVYVIPLCGGMGANVLACFPQGAPPPEVHMPPMFILGVPRLGGICTQNG